MVRRSDMRRSGSSLVAVAHPADVHAVAQIVAVDRAAIARQSIQFSIGNARWAVHHMVAAHTSSAMSTMVGRSARLQCAFAVRV